MVVVGPVGSGYSENAWRDTSAGCALVDWSVVSELINLSCYIVKVIFFSYYYPVPASQCENLLLLLRLWTCIWLLVYFSDKSVDFIDVC